MTWVLIVAHITIASWTDADSFKANKHCEQFKRYFTLVPAKCVLQVNI